MTRREGCRIAVIGAGFSGVMTAIHLLWRCRPGERVYLIERSARVGPGVAYGSNHPRHLVNVRAENMSAFEDEPDHFLRWLGRLDPQEQADAGERTIAGTFVRRSVYGRYIQELLRDAIARQDGGDNLFLIPDQAVGVRRNGARFDIATANGRQHPVDAVVLALGNLPPRRPMIPGYMASPWARGALLGLRRDEPVVLLGTGLTMVDACLALIEQGFSGPIHAVSRRGLLPLAHGPATAYADLRLTADDRRSLLALFKGVRREVERAARDGVGWRTVVDAARPHLQTLWMEMTLADKKRFLRHVRPWWDAHRHRMAPTVAATIASLQATRTLQVHTGRIGSIQPDDGGLRVSWRPLGAQGERTILAQRVIDCTGLADDFTKLDDPLIQQLLGDGMVRPSPVGLGLDCTSYGAVVDQGGHSSRRLFAVGPITRGALWEITSVPEIRSQAERVASHALAAARKGCAAAA